MAVAPRSSMPLRDALLKPTFSNRGMGPTPGFEPGTFSPPRIDSVDLVTREFSSTSARCVWTVGFTYRTSAGSFGKKIERKTGVADPVPETSSGGTRLTERFLQVVVQLVDHEPTEGLEGRRRLGRDAYCLDNSVGHLGCRLVRGVHNSQAVDGSVRRAGVNLSPPFKEVTFDALPSDDENVGHLPQQPPKVVYVSPGACKVAGFPW